MAPRRCRNAQLTPVTLGIDIGSVSSRAYLWCASTNTGVPISNPSRLRTLLNSTRYEKGDFPSTCYPFDNTGPTYPDPDKNTPSGYPNRQSTSLKYAPYILVNSSDALLEQYMLFEALIERRDDAAFRDRLRSGLEGLFTCIAAHVEKQCKAGKFKVTEIALTIPAQWDLDFEDLYSDIVRQVFGAQQSNIHFCTETEALANFLLREHVEDLEDHNSCNRILFLDFGGHNMNGCLFEVVTTDDGDRCFYRIASPFGVGGGSEQWEHNILQLCIPLFEHRHGMKMTPKHKQCLLDEFNHAKVTVDISLSDSDDDTLLTIKENGKGWDVLIAKEKVNKAWEEAHKGPLALAADRIADVANRHGTFVVVSGGTARHRALRERLAEMCHKGNLPEPFYPDEQLHPAYLTTIIAQGAAYAVGSRITTQQFFQRGAAIGLQMKQGTENPEGLWDDTARFLTDINQQATVELTGQDDGSDHLRLVCDPCFSQSEDRENLHYTKCYILLTLGKLPAGEWQFHCQLEGEGDDMTLVLERSRKVFRRNRRPRLTLKKDRPSERAPRQFYWKPVFTYRLPLYFDAGANCVHVGARGRSISELGLGIEVVQEEETDDNQDEDDNHLDEDKQVDEEQSEETRSDKIVRHKERIVERGIDPFQKHKRPSWAGTGRNHSSPSGSRIREVCQEPDGTVWQGDRW